MHSFESYLRTKIKKQYKKWILVRVEHIIPYLPSVNRACSFLGRPGNGLTLNVMLKREKLNTALKSLGKYYGQTSEFDNASALRLTQAGSKGKYHFWKYFKPASYHFPYPAHKNWFIKKFAHWL